ncbi:MAG: beta-propeller domain-containing protein, partial [Mycobacteriales bacterium]
VGDRVVVLSAAAGDAPGYGPMPLGSRYGYPGATPPGPSQAAVVDLSDPGHPRLADTFSFDGSVVAARSVGTQVRLVLRSDGPRLTFQTATSSADDDAATAANKALIASSTLGDWLPSWQLVRPDGSTTPRRQLAACDAVARPQHATGISTVSVLSLDPQASAPGPATSVVAAGDTVYATADHLVVAGAVTAPPPVPSTAPHPVLPGGPAPSGRAVPCCVAYTPGPVTTWLYDFETSGSDRPVFLGAGSVPGSLLDAYAIDQAADGSLRVATTTGSASGSEDSRITVLAPSGHELSTEGVVAGLGNGQQLRAVRFLGDQAYVVTYRSFDPLYVVDLRNPHRPAVTGQLEQPGFSAFLYPLPHHRLLGVGVQVTNGEASGLEVATYDVSDPARPRRIDAAPLASGFFPASQGYDPHAFLYWQPADLAVLAVPSDVQGGAADGAVAYRVAAGGGLTEIATLGHGTATTTRTAVIGDALWAFTPSGVVVAGLTSLGHTTWHPYR